MKCKHPTFKFKFFNNKTGKLKYKWLAMGYNIVCGKCGEPIGINDIRKQKDKK